MKAKLIIPAIALLFLSSCIVKSLHPFYTKDSVKYYSELSGEWQDKKGNSWTIISFNEEWEKETKKQTKLSKEDKDFFEKFKDGYVVTYTTKKTQGEFVAMPFEANGNLFLDFTPFYYEAGDLNGLVAEHLFKTHSVAKVIFNEDGGFDLKFLSEEKIKPLFTENKIKLKHENSGIDEDLILTASSEELYAFLIKYDQSNIEAPWEKDVYNLSPLDAKP